MENTSKLKIIRTVLNVGAEKPFKVLHVTDSHITRGDVYRGRRTKTFSVDFENCAEEYFFAAMRYAEESSMPVLHTGDLIDFFSPENFDFIDKHFSGVDYIYAGGNHDFCHFLGKAKEDYAYKWEKIKDIAPHFKCSLYFASRVIGGVNFVTLDNSYYFITVGQLEALRAEAAKGLPIILAMHVPIYTEGLARKVMEEHPCAYLCGAPKELLAVYPEERRIQQTPDEATLRAIEYIKSEPLIKAVVTGHTHMNFEEALSENLVQYTTHGSFAGFVREITVL